jgi:hypothetical protein
VGQHPKTGTEALENPFIRNTLLIGAAKLGGKAGLTYAADTLDFVPLVGEVVLAGQIVYGGVKAWRGYKETFDACMEKR